MPDFSFEAVDSHGARTSGREDAADAQQLARSLERRGLYLLEANEANTHRLQRAGFTRRRERIEFTRAMAALLPAGLPLARALESAAALTSGAVRTAVDEARTRVVRGEPLAVSLGASPGVFPPLYVGIVHAGERRSDLASAFAQLAAQLEREDQLRGRLLSALLYPALLAVAGALAIAVLMLVVLPQFTALLDDAGAALPVSTQLLVSSSKWVTRVWPALVAMPLLATVGVVLARRTDVGQQRLAELLLAMPVLGALRRQVLAARFARLLSTLLGGGAPLYGALGDVVASLDDPVARSVATDIRRSVKEGVALHMAIAEHSLFPSLLAQLVAVGEESSRLREFLVKAADILDERAERAAQRAATLAEPTLIVVFGAMVALIAFALLQAIYSVNAGSFAR